MSCLALTWYKKCDVVFWPIQMDMLSELKMAVTGSNLRTLLYTGEQSTNILTSDAENVTAKRCQLPSANWNGNVSTKDPEITLSSFLRPLD